MKKLATVYEMNGKLFAFYEPGVLFGFMKIAGIPWGGNDLVKAKNYSIQDFAELLEREKRDEL